MSAKQCLRENHLVAGVINPNSPFEFFLFVLDVLCSFEPIRNYSPAILAKNKPRQQSSRNS